MIFDDYDWNVDDKNPKKAIDRFLSEYSSQLNVLGMPPASRNQVIVSKTG